MIKNIFLLLLIFTSLHAQIKDVSLVLPWKHQFQFAGYYMAQEKGFYKDVNLNVSIKEFDTERNNIQSVATQKADFGIRHSVLILDKINNYPNIKLLAAINQSSPLVLITRQSPTSNSLQDIKNKNVMMSFEDNDNAAINAMLYSQGINRDDFNQTLVDFTLDSFINSSTKFRTAYISNEPYQLQSKGIPFNLYKPQDYGYDFYSDILFTSQEFIDKEPRVVRDFYTASLLGWEYAYEHIDESIEVILKHYNTQNKTQDALLYEANALKKLAFEDDRPIGNITPERLEKIANTYQLLGLLKVNKVLDFNKFIYKTDNDIESKKLIKMFSSIYQEYKNILFFILLLFIIIPLFSLILNYRLKKLLQKKTYALEESYKIVNNNISISKTDLAGKITYVSKAFCKATGYSQKELIGKNHSILKDSEHALSEFFYKDLWLTITSGHVWRGQFKNINKDGSSFWAASVISPIFDSEQKIVGFEAIRQDITIRKVLQEFNDKLEEEVKEQTLEIKKSEEFLDTLFDLNPNISYVMKHDKIERVNKAFLSFTGFNSLENFFQSYSCICELFNENKHKDTHYVATKAETKHSEQCSLDDKISITYKGNEYIFLLTAKQFVIHNEEITLISLEDITALEKIATTDKLTSTFNRVKIDKEIEKNFTYYKEHNENFALILLDIDFFKDVNDIYGHQVGDIILQEMSQITQKNIRNSDILGRWGGEEFMVICPNTTTLEAVIVAEKIRKKIQVHKFPRIENLNISAGVSDIKTSKDINTLISNADVALYKAKELGRNRVES